MEYLCQRVALVDKVPLEPFLVLKPAFSGTPDISKKPGAELSCKSPDANIFDCLPPRKGT